MRWRKWLTWLVACLAISTVQGMLWAQNASLTAISSIENFEYDLGTAKLTIEQIDSKMRLQLTTDGRLEVRNIDARRMTLTITGGEKPPATSESSGLPDQISLPFPIAVQAAHIQEFLIINGDDQQRFEDIRFNFTADSETIGLDLLEAQTPFGNTTAKLSLENTRGFPLSGNVRVEQAQGETPYDLTVNLSGSIEQLGFNLEAYLEESQHQRRLVSVWPASTPAPGKLAIQGKLGLMEEALPLTLKADVQYRVDDKNHLHLISNIEGTLSPEPQLALKLQATDSLLKGEPLQLVGNARLKDSVLNDILINASVLENTLTAQGSLGSENAKTTLKAELNSLSIITPEANGSLMASGALQGRFDALQWQLDWNGAQIRLSEQLELIGISGKASANPGAEGHLASNLDIQEVYWSDQPAFRVSMALEGTSQSHTLNLNAKGKSDQLIGRLSGKIQDDTWQGVIEKLQLDAKKPIRIEKPINLSVSSKGWAMQPAAILVHQGRLEIASMQSMNGIFESQGKLVRLSLRDIPEVFFRMPENLTGNLTFAGEWQINAADALNAQLGLRHVDGDLGAKKLDGTSEPLGIQEISTTLNIKDNQLTTDARLAGRRIGDASFNLTTRFKPTAQGFALESSAPLTMQAKADIKHLDWIPIPSGMLGAVMDGQLQLAMQGKGTIASPGLQGSLNGQALSFLYPMEGVDIAEGILKATFSQDILRLEQLQFKGGEGTMTATGNLQLIGSKPTINVVWKAEDFTAVSRTDRLIVIEGEVTTGLKDEIVIISGGLDIKRGLIQLPPDGTPSLSDDVVIIGQIEKEEVAPLAVKVSNLKIGIGNAGVVIDQRQGMEDFTDRYAIQTGNVFRLQGRGLDTTLNGILTLSGEPQQKLRGEGNIQVAGTYMAYGQLLNIERGKINFSGLLENPGLNIRAMRDSFPIRAGVEITGTVMNPFVKLVSIPEVPDSEKLAYLILGHGAAQAGRDQFAILSLAAGALLSSGESVPLQTRFARAAGLDNFNISGNTPETTRISMGKRLADNLYLSYQKEITGLLNVARLTYDITNRWSVRTQAGSESAVDVLYTFSFK